MNDKFNITEYFSEKEIIKILCKKRAISAKKTHDYHFLRNISTIADSPHKFKSSEIYSFFPARSKWIRLNKNEREQRDSNAIEINAIQLERTLWREIKRFQKCSNSKPDWLIKLQKFTYDIRESVFNESLKYQIKTPRIIPILKDKNKNEFRPISVFGLKDLIIIGQIAKYLTNCIDPLFLDSSYAFRARNNNRKILNHHEAIKDIIEFKKKIDAPIFASECDIKKFFDCVNHKVILEKFQKMVEEVDTVLKIKLHSRAIYFFRTYLDAFSFNKNINQVENHLLLTYGIKNGSIPWVSESELIEVDSHKYNDEIGIPQGGAISCLIANILLHHVDKKLVSAADENTFYARFCDDMILLNKEKDKCEELLEIYQTALKEIKLISHKPAPFITYGREFWDEKIKSKLAYKWDSTGSKNCVPWLSFVGYQIRYDGIIRVRNKSIKKELRKQVAATDKIINVTRKSANINEKAIKFRLQQRLISMAVSRFKFGNTKISMCWCSGFRLLKHYPNVANQIKCLDRNREKQIKRLKNQLTKINTPFKKSKKEILPLKYYGFNYSYHKQFIKF